MISICHDADLFLFIPKPSIGLFIPTPKRVKAPSLPAQVLEFGFLRSGYKEFPSNSKLLSELVFCNLHKSIKVD